MHKENHPDPQHQARNRHDSSLYRRAFSENRKDDSDPQYRKHVSFKTNVCLVSSSSNELPRLKLNVTLNDIQTQFKCLLDSGSTHSFLNLSILPKKLQKQIKNFMENPENTLNNLGLNIKHAYVETFNGKLQITCVEVKLNFTLQN